MGRRKKQDFELIAIVLAALFRAVFAFVGTIIRLLALIFSRRKIKTFNFIGVEDENTCVDCRQAIKGNPWKVTGVNYYFSPATIRIPCL